MITGEELLSYMRTAGYKPQTGKELVGALKVAEVEDFLQLLNRLEKEGKVILTRKHRYGVPERMGLIVGRLQGHAKGFGFVIPDNPEQKDVHVSLKDMKGAMHNDRVIVRPVHSSRDQDDGEIVAILERANREIVGTFEKSQDYGFVVPDDTRLYYDVVIPAGEVGGAQTDDKVVVEVTRWPQRRRNPEGRVTEVLGRQGEKGVDVLSIIRKYGLPMEFDPVVMKEARTIPQKVSEQDISGRRDLRGMKTVTIDGADAKDLDDAVSVEKSVGGHYLLHVHIADVGNYVKQNSPLDREAYSRGTSVYLTDRVVPMLPHELSNGICSLNAGEDRLAMSVAMDVNDKGSVVKYEIFPSVIKVNERMTYESVKRILLENDGDLKKRYADFVPDFKLMQELCLILRDKRMRRGAVDFNFPEGKAVLDEDGKCVDIIRVDRTIAEQIIEEFMILANETVAEHMYNLEAPFVYRVHEEPEESDLTDLNSFLEPFGYHIKRREGKVSPKAYQEVVTAVQGKPEEKVISTVILRSMKHARYANLPLGHFGLASTYYCHFTSPIRRYPDLEIHRIIKESLKGPIEGARLDALNERVAESSVQSSMREQAAEEAERDCLDMKKAEYMQQHMGEEFGGVINSVLAFGFFVELPNTVEGLVHVSTLTDDYYAYFDKEMLLRGQHNGRTFRIGDEVRVQLVRVDVESRQVDFEIVED